MRRILSVMSIMAVTALLSAVGILAADKTPTFDGNLDELMSPPVKKECLIVAKNCTTDYGNLQERVNDLKIEISRGLYVYTPNELNFMKEQLKWLETEGGNVTM